MTFCDFNKIDLASLRLVISSGRGLHKETDIHIYFFCANMRCNSMPPAALDGSLVISPSVVSVGQVGTR